MLHLVAKYLDSFLSGLHREPSAALEYSLIAAVVAVIVLGGLFALFAI